MGADAKIGDVVRLSGGFYMVDHVIPAVVRNLWRDITDEQRAEFVAIYGDEDAAEDGLLREVTTADHAACFYNGAICVGLMWADWMRIDAIGLGVEGRVRTLGCVTTKRMRTLGMAVARHSDEMRDAFEMREPPDADALYVAIQKSYKQSTEWCVRMCKFTELGEFLVNGEPFVLYIHKHGEGVRR